MQLPQGRLAYTDQGDGPPIVFSHGLLVNSGIWDEVVAQLLPLGYRCIRPEMPMGAHTIPMDSHADLSPAGAATLLGDFLEALELEEATVVGNDSGGAVAQLLAARGPGRIGRLVLTNCDIGKAFPPFPYSLLPPLARMPGGMALLSASMRFKPTRQLSFRPLTLNRIPADRVRAWVRPSLEDPAIRSDVRKLLTGVKKHELIEAEERLRSFDRPVLFAWGTDDRFFKPALAEGLAAIFPDARIEWISGARTFAMLDRPDQVAGHIAGFVPAG